ncbi:MAG: hypothetical protein V4658_08690 [Bacteroidota bacterium]
MNIEFNLLPQDARVWVYAANRPLNESEFAAIKAEAFEFTNNWTAHQVPLKASFEIIDRVFLLFGVDVGHHEVSGCGIDKSVHLVQKWEQQFGLGLFNRMQLEYRLNGQVHLTDKAGLANALEQNEITGETPFYNKTITTVEELKTRFIIPLKQSWAYSQLAKPIV